jgi:hypothetical protein
MAKMNWTRDQSRRRMRDNGTDRSSGRHMRVLICPACGHSKTPDRPLDQMLKGFIRCSHCKMSIWGKRWGPAETLRRLR